MTMPSVRRCIFGCVTDGVTLHNFPNPSRFPEQFQRWVQLVEERVPHLTPAQIYTRKKVCDLHFTVDDRNRNNRLNALAIPVPFPYHKGTKHGRKAALRTSEKYLVPSQEHVKKSAINPLPTCDERAPTPNIKELSEENVVPAPKIYSWQKSSELVADQLEDDHVSDTMSMYCDDDSPSHLGAKDKEDPLVHYGFRCNVCSGDISGFRYTCVQCNDFDLCGACERGGAHDQHYVLRVPARRTEIEVQSVLDGIKGHLMQIIEIRTQDIDEIASIKSEIESENEDDKKCDLIEIGDGPNSSTELEQSDDNSQCHIEREDALKKSSVTKAAAPSPSVDRTASDYRNMEIKEEATEEITELPTKEQNVIVDNVLIEPAVPNISNRSINDGNIVYIKNKPATVKKIPILLIQKGQTQISKLITNSGGYSSPHVKFKVIKLPPGAKLKPISKGQLQSLNVDLNR